MQIEGASEAVMREALEKFAAQDLLELHTTNPLILSVNLDRLSTLVGVATREEPAAKRPRTTEEEIEWLLNAPTVRERENKKMSAEVREEERMLLLGVYGVLSVSLTFLRSCIC